MSRLREVLKLSLPLSAAQVAQSAMIFCDSVMFGILGVEELAGAGLGAAIFNFILVVISGLLAAVANEVAFHTGRGARQDIIRIVKAGLILVVVIAATVALAMKVTPALLLSMGQEPQAVAYASQYLGQAAWISLPAFTFMVLRGLAAGMSRTTSIMRISLAAVALNVPLSYALMTGWRFFPELGIAGVAIGTALVCVFMCVMLVLDLNRYAEVREVLGGLTKIKTRLVDFKPFYTLGLPIMLAWTMEAGLFTAATLLAGAMGAVALAAHQIALQAASMSFNIYIGFAQGASIRVGQCYGEGRMGELKSYAWTGLSLGGIFCLVSALVFLLLPEQIVGLFTLGGEGALDQDVMTLGVSLLAVAAIFQVVDGAQVIMMTALRALRMGAAPTLITVVGYWLVGFPVAWLLKGQWGIVGVWMGLGVGLGFTAICLTTLFNWRVNRALKGELRKENSTFVTAPTESQLTHN
ncbi:MATE family efflux transporter [Hahella sp. CR1]|uniref:MATE family efflux transporter n=2 Tax=unclassified Hahella TaxID=2624107 RepID=UPI002441F241|nr:MATE family efflux transporter [Hahella sp. CR1]MDG9668084.1 MATE family efflux transporter [Hahella sp. CR1]